MADDESESKNKKEKKKKEMATYSISRRQTKTA